MIIMEIPSHGFIINNRSVRVMTEFIECAWQGNLKEVQTFIESGVSVDVKDHNVHNLFIFNNNEYLLLCTILIPSTQFIIFSRMEIQHF